MNRFFTADDHFGHPFMITKGGRPYHSVAEMNEDLIRRWNEVVRAGDIVYVLGDFGVKLEKGEAAAIFKRLNGEKFLVVGNHDEKNTDVMRLPWKWVGDRKSVTLDGQKIVLEHFPLQAWDGSMAGSWHLYGHVHGGLPEHRTCLKMDVGVDVVMDGGKILRPLSYEEIKGVLSKRDFVPPDRRRVYYEEDFA